MPASTGWACVIAADSGPFPWTTKPAKVHHSWKKDVAAAKAKAAYFRGLLSSLLSSIDSQDEEARELVLGEVRNVVYGGEA